MYAELAITEQDRRKIETDKTLVCAKNILTNLSTNSILEEFFLFD
jgi:hypothetical protein